MLHIFKSGGNWKAKSGDSYTVKAINEHELDIYLLDGWVVNINDAFSIEAEYTPVETSDYEGELRDKIKALGGTAGSRSKVSTLESQLKALENADNKD